MLVIYNLLLTLLSPVWGPWMLLRARQRGAGPDWKERTGDYDFRWTKGTRRVWLHAVSVGEVVAALPILRELRERMPDHEIVLSVTTTSGQETAVSKAEGLYDRLVYFPIDILRFAMAALTRVRPEVVVIMETELWPNFLWAARQLEARVVIANARLSDRAWPRARRLRFFYRWMLGHVDRVLAQSEGDAERFRALGAGAVEVVGNVKFDEAAGLVTDRAGWRARLGIADEAFVVMVGSLRAEEFALVLPSLTGLRDVTVVVAPRHLEKTDELLALLPDAGRRSMGGTGASGLLVLDTYGELGEAYAAADVAVIGGGFADLGGQNPLQALAHGVPVVFGPHMRNFRDIAALAVSSGAALACDAATLLPLVDELRGDRERLKGMGEAAQRLVTEHSGAAARVGTVVAALASEPSTRRN